MFLDPRPGIILTAVIIGFFFFGCIAKAPQRAQTPEISETPEASQTPGVSKTPKSSEAPNAPPKKTVDQTPPATTAPSTAVLERLDVSDYPRFGDNGIYDPLLNSIEKSLAYLKKLPADRGIVYGDDTYPVSHLIQTLETFSDIIKGNPSQEELNQIIKEKFHVYQSVGRNDKGEVLFTGYYEPLLQASRSKTSDFTIPVHSKPSDIVEIDLSPFAKDLKGRTIVGQLSDNTVIPYPSRKDIRKVPGFNATAPPIAWLQDEVDLLILQIQGSGRFEYPNGKISHVLYDGSNGRPYRSIGRLLIDTGLISAEAMSMQTIRDYLKQNPKISKNIINYNPRYIFFKSANKGPMGALGQPLTPMRSLAVDRSIMPSAALAFINTPLPDVNDGGEILDWHTYRGFALAQDAGSAIKGPGRVDLFMGHGSKAEVSAGHLKHTGALYLLVLKPDYGTFAVY